MNEKSKKYFPLFIDLSDKKIVIIGAGQIAARRAASLAAFCGDIVVIAPRICERIKEMSINGSLKLIEKPYEPGDIEDAFIVLAATDSKSLNDRICTDGRAKGIYVNHASDQNECDFFFPAVVCKDNIVAGISSGGSDHEAVRRARETIEKALENF